MISLTLFIYSVILTTQIQAYQYPVDIYSGSVQTPINNRYCKFNSHGLYEKEKKDLKFL